MHFALQMDLVGQVEGCDCILVDDMIDTAGTLCSAADELRAMGARSVYAYATHGCVCLALARRCGWIQAGCRGWIEMLTRGAVQAVQLAGGRPHRRLGAKANLRLGSSIARALKRGVRAQSLVEVVVANTILLRVRACGLRWRELRACLRVPRPNSAPPAAQEEVRENTTKIQVLSVGPLLAEVRGPRRPCLPRRSPAHPARRRPSAGCTPASPSR